MLPLNFITIFYLVYASYVTECAYEGSISHLGVGSMDSVISGASEGVLVGGLFGSVASLMSVI
jgi:hypothetical protein